MNTTIPPHSACAAAVRCGQSRYGSQFMHGTPAPSATESRPRLYLTLGDVAGIGPEIICKAWMRSDLHAICRPIVVGDAARVRQTLGWLGLKAAVVDATGPDGWEVATPERIVCHCVPGQDLSEVPLGQIDARAGRAAYNCLVAAIGLTLRGRADAIVTAPLHKEALHAAGIHFPGHTEILAEETGTKQFAMMLYGEGIGVAHVTLHVGLRQIFPLLTVENVLEKIRLTHDFLLRLRGAAPKIGVCSLNPHAGEGGLFGDEEARIIAPAVARAKADGIGASGPWPSDTLFGRARQGEFQGVVAMYHDQGHIAMKLLAGLKAVNVSLGLPLIRTSVAHGTAFDIAPRFRADPESLLEAVRVAVKLCQAGIPAALASAHPSR